MAVTQQEHDMCKQTDVSFMNSMCFSRFFIENPRKLPAVSADSRKLDRKPLPARGRSVISMKEPIPLYLSHATTSSDSSLPPQLRRINSSPTTFRELKISPSEKIRPAASFPFSNRLFCVAKDMQAPAEIAAPQTLFDLGIFQSSGKGSGRSSPSSLGDGVEELRPCASLGSPFEERCMVDCYEYEGDHDSTNTSQMSGGSRSPIDPMKLHNLHGVDNMVIASSRTMNGSSDSLPSDMIEPESSSSRRSSIETSWLDDPSDDDEEEDQSNSSQFSLTDTRSPNLDCSEAMNVDFGLENLHEPSIEYAAALAPSKATLIDVVSIGRSSSISSGDDHPASPTSITQEQSRSTRGGPVTPPSSPRSSIVTIDYEREQTHHAAAAETQGLTILTPPPTPEKGTPRPSLSASGLSDILTKLSQAIAINPAQIDSTLVDHLREHIQPPQSSSQSATTASTTQTSYSRKNPNLEKLKQQTPVQDVVNILPSGIHRVIQVLNLLDDLDVNNNNHNNNIPTSSQSQRGYDFTTSRARINLLKTKLKECVVRGIVECQDAGKEVLVGALSVVVRLAATC